MASTKEYLNFVLEQLSDLNFDFCQISARPESIANMHMGHARIDINVTFPFRLLYPLAIR